MYYLCCAEIGYLLGSVSPSYILGRVKGVDMRRGGTKNLGASNTFMHLGCFWGFFVMAFDIFKAYFAVKLCEWLFRELVFAGLVAGGACVIGHNYPFYLKFKGGKGLASFGGLVLGVSPLLFLCLLLICTCIALMCNYGCVLALSAAVLFPVLAGFKYGSVIAFAIAALCCAGVFIKHTENIRRIRSGEETKFTVFIGKYLFHKEYGQEESKKNDESA